MVANFSTLKDQACVIRALKLVRQVVPRARLTLVGRDWGTLGANRQLATELEVVKHIRFVTNSSLPEFDIAECSVGVLASSLVHGEGISNAILEYMALAKPVVVTEGGGNRELVRVGKNGFLVPVNTPEAVAKRVVELLRTPDLARRLGEAGRRIVAEDFSLDRMLSDYEGLYSRLRSAAAGSNRMPVEIQTDQGKLDGIVTLIVLGRKGPHWIPFQAAALALSHTLNASFRNRLNVSLLHK